MGFEADKIMITMHLLHLILRNLICSSHPAYVQLAPSVRIIHVWCVHVQDAGAFQHYKDAMVSVRV
jgi:hypothetical protein